MENLFARLFDILKNGEDAVLITTCGPDGIAKTLRTGGELAEWAGRGRGNDSLFLERGEGKAVIIERFLPRPRMIIFGGGHVSLPLSRMASMLDFDVTVFDDRPAFASVERFPWASEVICDGFENAARLSIRASDYAVIVTRGHRHDQDCLRAVFSGEAPFYMGMIGSRRRVAVVRGQMNDEGYDPALVERLHAPIGLSIGAVTPEEISVSILAEVISEKRSAGPARQGENYADMALMEWLACREEKAALVTVLSTSGSTPRESGAKMVVQRDGRTIGSIGGGCAEAGVIRAALDLMERGRWRIKNVDMTDSAEEDGMVCGGSMETLIEGL
ncbi:MAG: XdhC family protein [Synergistaceae bacterium]|jgi:xanthine dehydrogenase accessory factor|nr:XdhC family protein [Synergistaceae bacterium]